jgi:hypothetical protein
MQHGWACMRGGVLSLSPVYVWPAMCICAAFLLVNEKTSGLVSTTTDSNEGTQDAAVVAVAKTCCCCCGCFASLLPPSYSQYRGRQVHGWCCCCCCYCCLCFASPTLHPSPPHFPPPTLPLTAEAASFMLALLRRGRVLPALPLIPPLPLLLPLTLLLPLNLLLLHPTPPPPPHRGRQLHAGAAAAWPCAAPIPMDISPW